MRRLMACSQCRRQYDVSDRRTGQRFHCSCGALLEVPAARGHEAAVVRCSACGAPRNDGEHCGFCGASFTLDEKDRNTLCPTCFARISDRARYCHHCATAIAPENIGAEETDRNCPACTGDGTLRSRRLGSEALAVLECGDCGGLWVGSDAFRQLERRARSQGSERAPAAAPPKPSSLPTAPSDGPLYRPCVVCGRLMHRQNYGRRSGVIVDRCREHGVWFDDRELARVLQWLRQGGLQHAERLAAEDDEQRRRLKRLEAPAPAEPLESRSGSARWGTLVDVLAEVASWIDWS